MLLLAKAHVPAQRYEEALQVLPHSTLPAYIPGWLWILGFAPRYARLTLALRPSIKGLGVAQALSAPSLSAIVTCAKEVSGDRVDSETCNEQR